MSDTPGPRQWHPSGERSTDEPTKPRHGTVQRVGLKIAEDGLGSYALAVWYRLQEGGHQEERYDGLAWPELVDVVVTELDRYRPGHQVGKGWLQPSLHDDLDRPRGE